MICYRAEHHEEIDAYGRGRCNGCGQSRTDIWTYGCNAVACFGSRCR